MFNNDEIVNFNENESTFINDSKNLSLMSLGEYVNSHFVKKESTLISTAGEEKVDSARSSRGYDATSHSDDTMLFINPLYQSRNEKWKSLTDVDINHIHLTRLRKFHTQKEGPRKSNMSSKHYQVSYTAPSDTSLSNPMFDNNLDTSYHYLTNNAKATERFRYFSDKDMNWNKDTSLPLEHNHHNQMNWNTLLQGTSVTTSKYNCMLNNHLALLLSTEEDFAGILQLIKRKVSVFVMDLFSGSIATHQNTVTQLRKTKQFLAKAFQIPVNVALINIISPRLPITGTFAKNNVKSLEMRYGKQIIVTADRAYSQKGSVHVIYVNCSALVYDLKECDTILIDQVHLRVLKQANKSVLCKVTQGGYIKAQTPVRFPEHCDPNVENVTPEEVEDLTFSMAVYVSAVILPTAGCPGYLANIKETLKLLKYNYCRLFATIYLNDFNNMKRAEWIANNYDGVNLCMFKKAPSKKQILSLTKAAKHLIKLCHSLKKPIIFGEFFTSECLEDQSIIVDPESHKFIFYYTDKFLISFRQRTISYLSAYLQMAEDRVFTVGEYAMADLKKTFMDNSTTGSDTFARSVVKGAYDCKASCIIVSTVSGRMAAKISHYRPNCPIIALSDNIHIVRYLNVCYNVWVAFYNNSDIIGNRKVITFKKLLYGIIYALTFNAIKDSDNILFVYRAQPNSGYPNKCLSFNIHGSILKNFFRNL